MFVSRAARKFDQSRSSFSLGTPRAVVSTALPLTSLSFASTFRYYTNHHPPFLLIHHPRHLTRPSPTLLSHPSHTHTLFGATVEMALKRINKVSNTSEPRAHMPTLRRLTRLGLQELTDLGRYVVLLTAYADASGFILTATPATRRRHAAQALSATTWYVLAAHPTTPRHRTSHVTAMSQLHTHTLTG